MLHLRKGSGIIKQRLPFSVGIDIVSIERIERAFRRHPSFAARILNDEELAEMVRPEGSNEQFPPPIRRNVEFLASRYAVKEAASKALHINLFSVSFHDFVVAKHPIGFPILSVSDAIQRRFSELGGISFEVSISHERSCAIAVVNSFFEKGDQL